MRARGLTQWFVNPPPWKDRFFLELRKIPQPAHPNTWDLKPHPPHQDGDITSTGQDLLQLQQREAAPTTRRAHSRVCVFLRARWSLSPQGAPVARPFPGSTNQQMPLVPEMLGNCFFRLFISKITNQQTKILRPQIDFLRAWRRNSSYIHTSSDTIYFYDRQIEWKVSFLYFLFASSGAETLAQEQGWHGWKG